MSIYGEIWKELWETSIEDYYGLSSVVESYFAYLKETEALFFEKLRESGFEITPDLPDLITRYIALITLGPQLVEGYRVLSQLLKLVISPIYSLEDIAHTLSRKPSMWEGSEALKKINQMRRIFWSKSRSSITSALKGVFREVENYSPLALLSSYLLGILDCKDPWDPPECYTAAVRIVRFGIGYEVYAKRISSYIDSIDSEKYRNVLKRWLSSEREIREYLRKRSLPRNR